MQFDTSYLTAAGREIATTELGGLDLIQYTKAVASSDDYSSLSADDLRKLTSLDGVEQTVSYSKILKKDATTLALRVDFPSKDVKTAYELYTVGFYAKLKSGDEVLYAVLPSDTPDQISADYGKSNVNDSFTINSTVANTADVDFSLTAAGTLTESDLETILESKHYATTEYVNGKLTNYYTKAEVDDKFVTNDDFDSKLPKNIATTDAANTFAKSQTLAGGATDGKGNAYATTKDVATDLNNGLSTKADTSAIDPSVMIKNTLTADDDLLILGAGTYWVWGPVPKNYPTSLPWGTVVVNINPTTTDGQKGQNKIVEVTDVANNQVINTYSGSPATWSGWKVPNAGIMASKSDLSTGLATKSDDSKVVHTADMRKPASDVAGIEEVSAKQDKIGYTPADDSKVAHLSGANNFDTVPTVNNNPLLLASSLPSDLARTGQDANFTGKLQQNGQDVALANNTIARNPDTGVVSEPVDFTKLTVEGGKSVATSDDLKSLETSAWRVLDFKNIVNDQGVTPNIDNTSVFLYKLDEINKRIYMLFTLFGTFPTTSNLYFNFSNVVKNISFPTFEKYGFYINIPGYTSYTANDIKNNKLHISIANATSEIASLQSEYFDAGWHDVPCFVGYDELV